MMGYSKCSHNQLRSVGVFHCKNSRDKITDIQASVMQFTVVTGVQLNFWKFDKLSQASQNKQKMGHGLVLIQNKKLSFAQLQQLSYLKSLHGAVGNKKLNFDSQFSSVLLTSWKKVLIFLVIPFDFFSIMISSASHE